MNDSASVDHRERPLVSRLMGMETEYATLIANRPGLSTADLPSSAKVYARICDAIRRDQPCVPGVFDQDQIFLASGGAVTFESHPSLHALPGGLVEIATPEVTSPDELVACQRSIDELVSEAASESIDGLDVRVLKNSSDALGHIYGCQENYETVVAAGLWLLIYRSSILLLWMLQVISLLMSLPVLAVAFSLILLLRIRRHHFAPAVPPSEPLDAVGQPSASDLFETLPGWMKTLLMKMLRAVHFPTVLVLRVVARHIAFRKQRRYLTGLLVSRISLCGAGDLDHDGRFRLSPKAMAIDTLADMGCYDGERPIYVYGHWLGQFCAKSFLSLGSTRAMFARRQRLQIGLSDSNLSELAEYVKLGSVSLILDMIESGQTKPLLVLPHPITALHALGSDWNLVRRVATNRCPMNALEMQRHYLNAAKKFVEQTPQQRRGESEMVIERWEQLLEVVAAYRRDARNTTPALGRVDWLSKRWMIDQLGADAQWIHRKKTDLRYHELSPEGYYRKLAAINPSLNLISQDRIERRRRTPPPDSPASKRGWLIREFANSDDPVSSDWGYAVLGEGKRRKRIDFGS